MSPSEGDHPKLLTVPQLSQMLSISRPTVYRWVDEGRLRVYRLGRNIRVPYAEYERLLEESEVDGFSGHSET